LGARSGYLSASSRRFVLATWSTSSPSPDSTLRVAQSVNGESGQRSAAGVSELAAEAFSARVGLWGKHGYGAAYSQVFADADANELEGSRSYELVRTFTPCHTGDTLPQLGCPFPQKR